MVNSEMHPKCFNHLELAQHVLNENSILYPKIVEHCKTSRQAVPKALTEVIRFLNLIAYCNETLTPSKFVDDVWHEFILCTKVYIDFCQQHFDRIIHHYPGGTIEKNQGQFQKTIDLYKIYFGTPEPHIWGKNGILDRDAECGTCESL